ncbi:nucleotidyltransferase family protein [Undibacterium fentianense]|uniref:Nucleotidyltransferase family protein n=1 Tax=Undibacterium fentianense TaxID=2828728 RepID=A0A941IFU0_9BURK|nr:nucleotidyltransferase family protein [Undibacterium fentianense]MBR7800702.1 nucleotidyltransferase family protein [Undibacterium fentianense]
MREQFIADVLSNHHNANILARWKTLDLPDAWLVAGCLFQTVWNRLSHQAADFGIKDYDIFYFDPNDLSAEKETSLQQRAEAIFADLPIRLELCNQARVHLWYESYFGQTYPQLNSACEGIDRFLIPATCVGINPDSVYAPHGFEKLYQGVLSMNPLTPYRELYEKKASSYQQRWPWLQRFE